jgi:hypothetical protein
MIESTFVLTTNKCFKNVQEFAQQNGIQWNNIIVDEASSIYINSSDPEFRFQFLWFVTNNWIPLIFKNPSIIKSSLYYIKDRVRLHPDLEGWLLDNINTPYDGSLISSSFFKEYLPFFHANRGNIVLRNSTELINSSMKLPKVTYDTFQCRPNITLNSLMSYYLARNIEPNITSDKLINIFQALGVEFMTLNDYLKLQPLIKQNLIKRKVEDNECVICLERFEYPTIVNCCYNVYCGKCLLRNVITNHKCATCREPVLIDNMCCLKPLTQNEIILSRNKSEICLDILNNNKDGRFIIYTSFDNIYYQLYNEIDKLELKSERLESNLFLLLKAIKNYQEGKTNILFISNVDLIRGISLASTSHLIFYHELPVSELKQVLIHSAQRIGRTQPLKIIQLNSEIPI